MMKRRTMPLRASFACTTIFAAAIAACGFAQAPPASAPSPPDPSPAATLAHCIKTLTEEAKKSKADGVLARNERTFAKEFGRTLPADMLIDRIAKRIDSDDFIDAYIRWQLSAFEMPAFAMTDRAFDRLLQTLPAFRESPRANAGAIASLNRAAQAGRLTPKQQEQVNGALNDLAATSSAAAALNTPMFEFRAWLIERWESGSASESNSIARAVALAMERAAALAAAGWPNDDAKSQVDEMLEKSSRKREFTLEQRRDVMRRAERLVTTGRMFITSANIAGEALAIEYGTTGIFDFDVRRWERLLREPE